MSFAIENFYKRSSCIPYLLLNESFIQVGWNVSDKQNEIFFLTGNLEPVVESCAANSIDATTANFTCFASHPLRELSNDILLNGTLKGFDLRPYRTEGSPLDGVLIEWTNLGPGTSYEFIVVPELNDTYGDRFSLTFTTDFQTPVLKISDIGYVNESIGIVVAGTVENVGSDFDALSVTLFLGATEESKKVLSPGNVDWEFQGLVQGQRYNISVYLEWKQFSKANYRVLDIPPGSPKLLKQSPPQKGFIIMEFELPGFGEQLEYRVECTGDEAYRSMTFSAELNITVDQNQIGCKLEVRINSYVKVDFSIFPIRIESQNFSVSFESTFCIVSWIYEKDSLITQIGIEVTPETPSYEYVFPFSAENATVAFYPGREVTVKVTPIQSVSRGQTQTFTEKTRPIVGFPLLLFNESPNTLHLQIQFLGDISFWQFEFATGSTYNISEFKLELIRRSKKLF